jgi:hypothetical protein
MCGTMPGLIFKKTIALLKYLEPFHPVGAGRDSFLQGDELC